MINENLFPVLCMVLNLLPATVIILTFLKLPQSPIRTFFLLTLIIGTGWLNGMLFFWSTHITTAHAMLTVQLIFALGVFLLPAFAAFVTALSGASRPNPILYGFYASSAVLICLILLGLVVQNVEIDSTGVSRIHYGAARLYFVVHFVLFGAYIFYNLRQLSRKTSDDIIRFQLEKVQKAGWITFALIAVTNAIFPIFVGKSPIVLLGPVFPMIFLARIYSLLTRGDRYFLSRQFELLLARDSISSHGLNFQAWHELLAFLERVLESAAPEMNRRLSFAAEAGTFELFLTKQKPGGGIHKPVSHKTRVSRLIPGIIDQVISLDRDNKRLFFSLLKAQDLVRQRLSPDSENDPGSNKIVAADYLDIERIGELLAGNRSDMKDLTGIEFYCFSKAFAETVNQTLKLSRAHEPMIFVGEVGTGRTLLARIANQNCRRRPVHEIFPRHEELFPAEIARLMSERDELCVIVHDLSPLNRDQIWLVEKLIVQFGQKLSLYITGTRDFISARLDLPENLKRILDFPVIVPPLREREEDVFYLALNYIYANRSLYADHPFESVNLKFLQRELKKTSINQIGEIQNLILQLCLSGTPPVLSSAGVKEQAGMLIPAERFSPLEDSERSIIRSFLLKNRLNKSRTARELDITINTLVAKINRYQLGYLFDERE